MPNSFDKLKRDTECAIEPVRMATSKQFEKVRSKPSPRNWEALTSHSKSIRKCYNKKFLRYYQRLVNNDPVEKE